MWVTNRVWVLEKRDGFLIGTRRYDNFGNRDDRYIFIQEDKIENFIQALIKAKEYYKVKGKGYEVVNYQGGYLVISRNNKIFLHEHDLEELYLYFKERLKWYTV